MHTAARALAVAGRVCRDIRRVHRDRTLFPNNDLEGFSMIHAPERLLLGDLCCVAVPGHESIDRLIALLQLDGVILVADHPVAGQVDSVLAGIVQLDKAVGKRRIRLPAAIDLLDYAPFVQ